MSGDTAVTIPRSLRRSVQSATTGRAYELQVAWPEQPAPSAGFPVLYVVDASALFASVVESVRMRSGRSESTGVLPAVIVGIEFDGPAADQRMRRTFECTMSAPVHQGENEMEHGSSPNAYGGAASLLAFLTDEVQPIVGREFSIDVTRQTLIGHSLGGLFVVEALLCNPGAFSAYVALSPSLWWGAERILNAATTVNQTSTNAAVCVAVGEYEEELAPWQRNRTAKDIKRMNERRQARGMIRHTREFAERLRAGFESARVSFDLIPGEDHASMVPAALSRVLRRVLNTT